MKGRLFPAQPQDADELILREEDAREVSDGWREAVRAAIAAGNTWALREPDGTLVALGGAFVDRSITPWLLCSDRVSRHRVTLFRFLRKCVDALRKNDALIGNFIPKDSPRNRALVERLGFCILPSPRDGFDFFFLPHV